MVHMRTSREPIPANGHTSIGVTTSLVEGLQGINKERTRTEDRFLGVWKHTEYWCDDL
jgi:hypothetical protein